jgi:hypothetical protein
MTGIRGLDKVIKKLNNEIDKLEERTEKGVREGARLIKNRALPLTPRITGNLRDSAFVVARAFSEGGGNDPDKIVLEELGNVRSSLTPMAAVGYTARYARVVHENPNAGKLVGEWKFLETAAKQSEKEVLDIIRREAQVK